MRIPLLLLVLLAGCSTAGTVAPAVAPSTTAATTTSIERVTIEEGQSEAYVSRMVELGATRSDALDTVDTARQLCIQLEQLGTFAEPMWRGLAREGGNNARVAAVVAVQSFCPQYRTAVPDWLTSGAPVPVD